MVKRLVALLLVLVMVFAFLSTAALAEEAKDDGTQGFSFRSALGNVDYKWLINWLADIFSLVEDYSFKGLAVVIVNGIGGLFFGNQVIET